MQMYFSTTEVDYEPAYSGLYTQAVFIYKWSLRQDFCCMYSRIVCNM